MKTKRSLKVLAILSGCVLMYSCQKNEPIYSCDPEINEIVTKNLDEIHQMSRADIVEMEPDMSRACYVAFTKEQKLKLWNDKLQNALKLDWNEKEAEHIKSLIAYLNENPDLFDDAHYTDELLNDKFEVFMYKWESYAKDSLGWSRDLLSALIANPYTLLNTNGAYITNSDASHKTIKTPTEICNCDTFSSVECLGCDTYPCVKINGCGKFGRDKCNGRCPPYI